MVEVKSLTDVDRRALEWLYLKRNEENDVVADHFHDFVLSLGSGASTIRDRFLANGWITKEFWCGNTSTPPQHLYNVTEAAIHLVTENEPPKHPPIDARVAAENARNKFLYELRLAATPWAAILRKLNAKIDAENLPWQRLAVSGIRAAVKKYIADNGLPELQKRRGGRPRAHKKPVKSRA